MPIPFIPWNDPERDGLPPPGVLVCYLLHYTFPDDGPGPHGRRHYLGATTNLRRRLREHARGNDHSAAITRRYHELGGTLRCVGWRPIAAWSDERRLRYARLRAARCPLCRPAWLAQFRAWMEAHRKPVSLARQRTYNQRWRTKNLQRMAADPAYAAAWRARRRRQQVARRARLQAARQSSTIVLSPGATPPAPGATEEVVCDG